MLDTDKQALLSGRATIPYRITILGDTEEENVILTENDVIETSYEDFRYVDTATICIGQFVARTISGEIKDVNKSLEIEDKEIKVEMGIKTDDSINYYSLGNFLITAPNDNDVKDKTSFEAMDYTKKFNKPFDGSRLHFPCTALQLAQYCCDDCGVELATLDFTNNDFIVINNQYDSEDSYRKVMQDIGKLAYSWVRIGWDNKCYIDFDVPTEVTDDYNRIGTSNYYDLSYQKKPFGVVNRVVIGMSDIEGENAYVEDAESIAQNGLCELQIMDNNLTYTPELRQQVIDSARRLFGLTYIPLEIDTTGHPWLLGNELIEVTTTDDKKLYTIPLDRTIEYSGHIKTKLTSSADTSVETEYKNTGTLENEVKKTRIIVDKQNQTIQQVVENVGTYDNRISEVEQSVDRISQQVSQISDLTREASGNGKVSITEAHAGNLLQLRIYGDVLPIFPRDNLYPSDTLFSKPTDYFLTIKYQQSNEDMVKEIKLPFDYLLIKNDVYDEFVIENDGTCYMTRRLQLLSDGSIDELEQEIRIDYDNLQIPVYEGTNEYSINYYTPTIYVKYAVTNDLTDLFATKVEVNSEISQTRNEIELSVTEDITNATDTQTLISKINLSPGQIKLEGTVTANENFKILQDGSVEAVNGSFSGNIFLPDGGKVIGGDGLLTNLQFSSTGKYNGYDWSGVFAYNEWSGGSSQIKRILCDIPVDIYIPENFTVTSIKLSYYHIPIYWTYYNDGTGTSSDFWGSAKQLKLYNGGDSGYKFNMGASEYNISPADIYGNPMKNAFGADSYTPTNTSGTTPTEKTTVELTNLDSFESGHYCLVVRTAMSYSSLSVENCLKACGMGRAIVNILGYSSYQLPTTEGGE